MDVRRETALIELSQCVLGAATLPSLLRHAAQWVASALDAEYGAIWELLPDGRGLGLCATSGWPEVAQEACQIGLGTTSSAGYALRTGMPVIITDWSHETRFSELSLLRQHSVNSGLRVIIQGHGDPFGVLGVDSIHYRSFTTDDVQFLQAVANLLAIAVERIQAEELLRTREARFRRLAENAADIIYRYYLLPTPCFDYVSPASTAITGYAPEEYYADPQLALRLAHPEDRPLLEAMTRAPASTSTPLTVRVIRRDGTLIWTEQRMIPLHDATGQYVGFEGIVRDITERVAAYQTLEQRVEQRTHELERRNRVAQGLHTILTILNSNRTLDEILDHIIAQACQLLETSTGAIYRLYRAEAQLKIRASWGLAADDAALDLPLDWCAVSDTVLRRRPVVITDTALAVRKYGESSIAACPPDDLIRLAKRYRALLAVPLVIKDEVYGAIALYYPEPRLFCDEEIHVATAVSDQAALAIENARLIAATQDKAVLEERQRLARDLHDSVTQSLYSMTLYAEAAARRLQGGDLGTVASHLHELQDTAQVALQEMRLLIFELRPPILEEAGLVAAVQTRLAMVEERSHLETTLIVDGTFNLTTATEEALYRIVQEALNNVLKHARAGHVMITLRQASSMTTVEIADDGIGFDPAGPHAHSGLGLSGMAERVAQLGGCLLVQSAPGAGTQVRVEFCQ